MVNKLETLKTKSRLLIYFEILIIVSLFVITIVELAFTVDMNSAYNLRKDKYFLFVMNKRMVQDKFLANWDPLEDVNADCKEGFKKHQLLNFKTFQNVTLTDITDRIKRVNWKKDATGNKFYNSTFEGFKYYSFDVNKIGNETITLLYEYAFHTLGGYNFCSMEFYLDSEYKAFNIIPTAKKCNDVFPTYKTADCGLYANKTYRVCMLKDFMTFENNTKLSEIPDKGDDFYCPYNQIDIEVVKNPEYNSTNPMSNPLKLEISFALKNLSNDPALIDKAFLMNLAPFANVGDAYFLSNPNDTFVYYDPVNIKTYTVGEKYGFKTPSGVYIYDLDFVEYFNQTFFKNKTYLYTNYNNEIEYYAEPFGDFNSETKFYFPTDLKNGTDDALVVHFGTYNFPIISSQCFKEIFEKQDVTSLLGVFNNISMTFYTETSSTLFAWLFGKLFIYVYGYMKIRIFVLLDKVNMRMSEAEIESEKITKYTFKCLSVVILIILLFALITNNSRFNIIETWVNDIVTFNCFTFQRTELINAYGDFSIAMKHANDKILTCMWATISLELIQILLFLVYDYTDNSPIIVENDEETIEMMNKKKTF